MQLHPLRALAIAGGVAALIAPVAASPALAGTPVREWVSIDETFVWDDCGFPVEQHDTLRLHFVSWFDDSGNRERQGVLAPGARSTYTNLDTGASVSAVNPYAVHKTDNPDGSATIAFTGLAFAIQGGGTVYVSSGRSVILFTETGITELAGSGPSADLCEALTATIG